MTVEQTDNLELCNSILNLPEVKKEMMIPEDSTLDIGLIIKEDSILLIFRDNDKKPVGLIWLDREPEPGEKEDPYVAHVALSAGVRGSRALKVISGAINHVFYRNKIDVVYAKAPYRRSHLLLKHLGWEDVRIQEQKTEHLGVIARHVMRLRRADWERRIAHRPYFIVGYPRSGTAWVSNLLTCGGSLCLHEGQRFGPRLETWLYSGPNRGNSDPSQIIQTDLVQANPDSPVVWIKRDRAAALRSFIAWTKKEGLDVTGGVEDLFDRLDAAHDLVLGERDGVLVVDFDKLFTVESARKIWRHCVPGLGFDEDRAKLLCGLNVQQSYNVAFDPTINPLLLKADDGETRIRIRDHQVDDWYRVTPAPGA